MACLRDDLLILGRGLTGLVHRQGHADGGTCAKSALQLNVPSMAADIALADAESEARALAALGGKERLENMRQNVGGDSAARVAHPQFDDAGGLLHAG